MLEVLTIVREGELQQRRNKERQATLGVVDLPAALTEPSSFGLVGDFVQTSVLSGQEDASQVCWGDGQHVGVVRGNGVEWVGQELHGSRHAVI